MKMWKANGNTTSLSFSLKVLEILPQERRGQLNSIMMEPYNNIPLYKFGPANKQHAYQSINPQLQVNLGEILLRTFTPRTKSIDLGRVQTR